MNLPRIQLEIYELWKTCWVPASCDLQPRILLSASKTWRQHNAWLAGNKLNYEEGVWRGRKRRNNWGVRERDVLARRKGRKPCLLFFPRASWFPPRPFTTPSNACHTGYKSGVLTSKHKLYVVQLQAISKTGHVKTRTRWMREEERTETLSSLLPRAPLSPPSLSLHIKCLPHRLQIRVSPNKP